MVWFFMLPIVSSQTCVAHGSLARLRMSAIKSSGTPWLKSMPSSSKAIMNCLLTTTLNKCLPSITLKVPLGESIAFISLKLCMSCTHSDATLSATSPPTSSFVNLVGQPFVIHMPRRHLRLASDMPKVNAISAKSSSNTISPRSHAAAIKPSVTKPIRDMAACGLKRPTMELMWS